MWASYKTRNHTHYNEERLQYASIYSELWATRQRYHQRSLDLNDQDTFLLDVATSGIPNDPKHVKKWYEGREESDLA